MGRPIGYLNIVLFSCLLFNQLADAESKSVSINDPRPIAKALERLEAIYGLPITYEDPIYIHESQLADVTERIRREPHSSANRVLIPKGETLSFTYNLPTTGIYPGGGRRQSNADRKAAVVEAIGSIFHGHAVSGGASTFTVIEDNGLFHVIPADFVNTAGNTEKATPLLDTTMTITPQQRTGADLVREICHSLSLSTGQTVVVGTTPASLLAKHATTIADSDATARSLLSRLFAEMRVPLSWQLFFDPGLQLYVLNIHPVVWVDK